MGITKADYLRMQARLGQRQQDTGKPTAGAAREADLHFAILDYCATRTPRPWLAFHGSMARATHRTAGEPDFIILAPGRTLFVECKRPGGKCSPAQDSIRAWAAALGHQVHVITSMQEFLSITEPNQQ